MKVGLILSCLHSLIGETTRELEWSSFFDFSGLIYYQSTIVQMYKGTVRKYHKVGIKGVRSVYSITMEVGTALIMR